MLAPQTKFANEMGRQLKETGYQPFTLVQTSATSSEPSTT
jgi:hypothetical protein